MQKKILRLQNVPDLYAVHIIAIPARSRQYIQELIPREQSQYKCDAGIVFRRRRMHQNFLEVWKTHVIAECVCYSGSEEMS